MLVHELDPYRPSLNDVGAFVEFLVTDHNSPATIQNYLTAVRAMYRWWARPDITQMLDSHGVHQMMKGIANTVRPPKDKRTAVTPEHLRLILRTCDAHREWLPAKLAISLAYFAYLRISNLAPRTMSAFDASRHATWADLRPRQKGLVLTLRWSKTRQHSTAPQDIPVSTLDDKRLCPKNTWLEYSSAVGEPSDPVATPLLRTAVHPRGRTISASMLTRSIRQVINAAGLSQMGYTPHSFRRGGASCSHHDGAPMEAIKHHGTWSSDAVHRYLLTPPEFKSPIIKAFKARFN